MFELDFTNKDKVQTDFFVQAFQLHEIEKFFENILIICDIKPL